MYAAILIGSELVLLALMMQSAAAYVSASPELRI